jgi:hypothetical protein
MGPLSQCVKAKPEVWIFDIVKVRIEDGCGDGIWRPTEALGMMEDVCG